ncbi:MAG: FAD:protein FMN transferase [Bacteroidales bacterium]
MQRLQFFISLGLLMVLFTSCNPQREPQKVFFRGEAQGTYYEVTYYDTLGRNFQAAIDSLLHDFDNSLSLWVDNSIISRVNRNETVQVDTLFTTVFLKSMEVARRTGGKFNPCIGPLVELWGFHRHKGEVPSDEKIQEALKHIDYQKVTLQGGQVVKKDTLIRLDFNAIAQGYSVDVIASFLKSKGINKFLIDVGGEVRAGDPKPDGSAWRVGIEKPADSANADREIQNVIELSRQAIATSGTYRKYRIENGRKMSHTIDPVTGYPVQHNLLSVSVVASDAITADAYATAFMVMGGEEAWRFIRANKDLTLEAMFVTANDKGELMTVMTPGFSKLLSQTK